MDINTIYQEIAHVKRQLVKVKKWIGLNGDRICQLELRLEELEELAATSREWRMKVLTNHGVEHINQDGELYAMAETHADSDYWSWENVTVCNLQYWLGY